MTGRPQVLVPRPLADLVEEHEMAGVFRRIAAMTLRSFEEDRRNGRIVGPTEAEAKRRTEICLKWFRTLRGDLAWSRVRTFDHLEGLLRQELDGVAPDPQRYASQAMWAPPTKPVLMQPTLTGGDLAEDSKRSSTSPDDLKEDEAWLEP